MGVPSTSNRIRAIFAGGALLALGYLCILLVGFPAQEVALSATRSYVYPVMGPRVSSDFGKRIHPVKRSVRHHAGIDLAAPHGSPVRAIADGIVIFADPYSGYGRLVVIQHQQGLTSHYGHLQEIKARPGQYVKAGQFIATVGSTGISTGPHLHFEVRVNGKAQDPENYLPGLAQPGQG